MKKIYILLFLLLLPQAILAQKTTSRLTVDTLATKTVRFIYISSRTAIASPVNGLLIRDSTASDSLFYYRNGWINLNSIGNVDSMLAKNAFGDSVAAIDSTYITNGKLGFEDINNLANYMESKTDTLETRSIVGDTAATLLKLSAAGDSAARVVYDSLVNSESITNKLLKSAAGDSAARVVYDSLVNSASITNKLLKSAAGDTARNAVHDTVKLLRLPLTYNIFGIEMFQNLDTSQTIGTSDSVWFYQNFDGDNPVLEFVADVDSTEGIQNGTTVAVMLIEKGVTKLDTVRFWIKTAVADTDTCKINLYVGEYNFTTGTTTYTDSSTLNTNTTWTLVRLTLSDNSYVAGDYITIRIRFWSLKNYWCRVKPIILVQE